MIKFLATALAASPKLVGALIRFAQRTPYIHITGADTDDVYMGRWWLIKHRAWLPFSVRIHHIVRPDHDRDLHDHPFDYRTVILRGWYIEDDIMGMRHVRMAGETAAARAQHFHRIAEVSSGGVWTLFIMGPRINTWGFLVGGRKINWRVYLGLES